MGESEPLDKNVKAAEVALKAEKAQVEAEKKQARERTAVDQKAAAELQGERAGVVKEMTPRDLPAVREGAQSAARHRGGRSRRRPLSRLQHGLAPAVFPGSEARRPGDVVRELPAHAVLQSAGRRGRPWACPLRRPRLVAMRCEKACSPSRRCSGGGRALRGRMAHHLPRRREQSRRRSDPIPISPCNPATRLHLVQGKMRNTVTVLAETKTIDGVECRVVLDREEKNGKPVEITRDYYAIDKTTRRRLLLRRGSRHLQTREGREP